MRGSLEELEARIANDLAYVDYPAAPWVRPRAGRDGERVFDVVVVGAGMTGLSVGFRLMRERILDILLIDENLAGREGPWLSYARMDRLRTPKEFVGPDCGFPSLSFMAWYQATQGEAAWQALGKAPRAIWMDYLCWFRRVAAIPVENETRLERIEPEGELLRLAIARRGHPATLLARKLVLATGFCAAGGGEIPDVVSAALPSDRYAHSADAIDFAALAGKRVAVLGAGASGFDNAAVALETGAASVDLFARRSTVLKQNVKETSEFSALLRHYGDLDDARRWRLMRLASNDRPPPPVDSIERCTRHANFRMHTDAHWSNLTMAGGEIGVLSSGTRFHFDFLILATGFAVELRRRPELAGFVDRIKLWEHAYTPPADLTDSVLGRHPYLGPWFEFLEREPGAAPFLANIHDFGIAAIQSMGPVCVGLNGMKIGTPRLVAGISRGLYLADAAAHEAALVEALRR